jgi:hypothetical protein
MGLLDGLLGSGGSDPSLQSMQLNALAAGLLSDNGSKGLGAGVLGMNNAKADWLKQQDLAQQIQLRTLQAQMMQRKQDMLGSLFSDVAGSPAASPPAQSAPAIQPSLGGALGSGTAGISIGGQDASGAAPASSYSSSPTQKLGLIAQARNLGIPDAAIAADITLNEGKGIADMLFKRGAPDMQVANGYAYDKNRVGAGFMPSLTTSTSGQTSMTRIGPDGLPVVSAPQGAIDTYAAYTDALKRTENKNTLLPLGYVGKGTGSPLGGTIADYLENRQPQPATGGLVNQGGGTLSPDLQAAILADAQKNGGPAPTVNLTAPGVRNPVFGLQGTLPPSVVRVQPGTNQGVGGAAGGLQSAAEAEAAKAQALADVDRSMKPGTTSATDIASGAAKNFTDYQGQLNKDVNSGYQQYMRNQQVRQLLKEYQTGLSAPDARSAFASNLQNLFPESDAARALAEKINGGNVGSGQELAQILSAAGLTNVIKTLDGNGRVNKAEYQALQEHAEKNTSDPSAMLGIMGFQDNLYKQQLAEQQALAAQVKAGKLNPQTWEADYAQLRHDAQTPSTLPPTPGQAASSAKRASNVFDTMPPANAANRGRTLTDTTTGKKYQSNGLQWQEIK